jgi:hypothetical protein
MMKRLVVYIVSVDEDIAEKAFRNAVTSLASLDLVKTSPKSIDVEPHDDYRGIVAKFEYDFILPEANENKNASKGLQDLIQSLIKAQLWNIPSVRVITETGVSN